MAGHLEKHITSVEKRVGELERRLNVNAFEAQKKLDELTKVQEKSKLNFLDIEKKFASLEERPSQPSISSEAMENIHKGLEEKSGASHKQLQEESAATHKQIQEESAATHKGLKEDLEGRFSAIGDTSERAHMKMREEYGDTSKEHQALEEKFEDRLRSIEDLLMLLEVEVVKSKDHSVEPEAEMMHQGIPKEWEDKLDTLDEKVKIIEKAKIKIPVERLNMDDRLRSIEDNFLSLEGRVKEEVSRIDNMVSGKALTEESTERFVEKIHERIEEVRRGVDKAQLLKNEITQREKDFAKRSDFDTFQEFVTTEISKLRQVVDRVSAMERSIDTHLIDIEEKVQGEVQKHSQSWKADIATHRRDIDLAVIKVEEKMLTAMSDEVKRIEQTMGSQRAEIENLIKVERQVERELEARATRIVTKELAEFASLMDKRFPHLVGKNDFDKFTAELVNRIEKVEAPDTGPMMIRIVEMENRIDEFYKLINQIATRMPLVME